MSVPILLPLPLPIAPAVVCDLAASEDAEAIVQPLNPDAVAAIAEQQATVAELASAEAQLLEERARLCKALEAGEATAAEIQAALLHVLGGK